MNITDIKIRHFYTDDKLKALVSITIDNELAIHDIKVIKGDNRLFVAMPSRRDDKGSFRDVVHPIKKESRELMEEKILTAYKSCLSEISEEI